MRKKQKLEETIQFVLIATLVAILLITFSQIIRIISAVWSYLTTEDLGYMWVINFVMAWLLTKMFFAFGKSKKNEAGTLGKIAECAVFCFLTLLTEILLWHRTEVIAIIAIDLSWKKIILAGVGILSATIAFLVHLSSFDYPDESDDESIWDEDDEEDE